jgi:NAD(P)-dependent dehydrogenase (short-subunit alcohol dehydrogenase family)
LAGAIVTGAAGGVGRRTCDLLGREGWELTLVDIDAERLEETGRALSAEGHAVRGRIAGDVSDPACAEEAVEVSDGGDGGVGALVNAAAILGAGAAGDVSLEDFDRVVAVNLRGTFLMMRAVLQRMRPRRRGTIVNVASVDAFVGEPQLAAYCASKGGVLQLTRAAAVDHARERIRINCVCPGAIDTPLFRQSVNERAADPEAALRAAAERHPIGRLLTPDDVAGAIAFLVDDGSAAITGSALVVDGGLTATWQFSAINK